MDRDTALYCVAAVVGAVLLKATRAAWLRRASRIRGISIAAAKRRAINSSITAAAQWLNSVGGEPSKELQNQVVSATVEQLVAMQAANKLTAVDILRVFACNALISHEKTNCLVWLDVVSAGRAAAEADAARKGGAALRRLHGIPISIKDNIPLVGTDATNGMQSGCNKPSEQDAAVVVLLRDAGAIVFAKTNIPQTLISFECVNYIFGSCINPYSKDFTCGGSSGGEGALIAMHGSAFGMGTDIGGSIRIPAHFCGIYGLKPSQWRVSMKGMRGPLTGQEAIPAVAGPMARCVSDLATVFEILISPPAAQAADGNVANAPFRRDVYENFSCAKVGGTKKSDGKPLKIGYYVDDGFVAASPACRRAVLEAVSALTAAGHQCVPFTPTYLGPEAVLLYYRLLSADGGRSVTAWLNDEPNIPHIAALRKVISLPNVVKRIAALFIGLRDPMMAQIACAIQETRIQEYWQLHRQRTSLRDEAARAFYANGLDAILCPGLATPAVPHLSSTEGSIGCMYTALLNLLDLPAVAVPVTTVQTASDETMWPQEPREWPMVRDKFRVMYDATKGHGLPVGVQIYGPKHCDEQALGCAATLEFALAQRKKRA